ncbi:olfactory receptor 1J4-like isoform X1 [Cervus elaphus]|uniref:olfactory receptor 1J4-like isoform X1 n=1 Tax=Cervus canadensis TaxID=1574408 RepID=UPI001C9E71F7|nr:olfactory receptor 1J4-like isoform X1 [Cervus canadensis]XP_043772881.1 olfactory receptor 1J4-like isoform X1 [Cervus elaphus]
MRPENQSHVSEFLLLGFPIQPEQQGMFFALFLGMYLTTVLGNLLIILLIRLDPRLHTPMYFFLSHLALTDVSFSSVTVPKMLINMQTQDQSIPYAGCITQMYFFLLFGCIDNLLLVVMAYDRYVAICHPLHYATIMSRGLCVFLLAGSWLLSCVSALSHTILLAQLMRKENQSSMSEFLLLGLPIRPEQQGVFFALFLGVYLTTVLGNLLIVLLIRLDTRLHTPMYFFLSHLAFSDISLSTTTVPKMLMNMQTQQQSISYVGCISQMYFFILFGCLDNFLLAVMAYDRYVAICQPLHYTTVMRQELCISLVAVSWFFCCIHALLHTLLLVQLSFCAENTISNFFCDLPALLKMSCSDISINELVIFTEGGMLFILPLSIILGSYVRIGTIVLRVPSTKRLFKAFSTCGSHLFVVSLYYGTLAGVYFFSSLWDSNDKDIIASVIYTVVTPMLNPFIYSLRNRDIKQALEIFVFRGNFFR